MPYHDDSEIRALYQELLRAWNDRNALGFAGLFSEDGVAIGFDGSSQGTRMEIEEMLRQVFAHHQTSAYVAKVKSVRFLADDVALLRAVAGMVPPGDSDINPAVNAVQSLVAEQQDGQWRIGLFQNTPAAFHGKPQLSQKLTEELRAELRAQAAAKR
jgi:uncharacterized protein (TIGR02246 family)